MQLRNRALVALGLGVSAVVPAFAAAPDMSALTGAVDLTTVATAILAIAALKIVPGFIKWGAGKVMSMFR